MCYSELREAVRKFQSGVLSTMDQVIYEVQHVRALMMQEIAEKWPAKDTDQALTRRTVESAPRYIADVPNKRGSQRMVQPSEVDSPYRRAPGMGQRTTVDGC